MKKTILGSVIFSLSLMAFLSCGNKSGGDSIVGKWQFEKQVKNKGRDIIHIGDYTERRTNVYFTFNDNGTCLTKRGDLPEEKGTYELKGKTLITKPDGKARVDTVTLLSVTNTYFQAQTMDSDVFQFKKLY